MCHVSTQNFCVRYDAFFCQFLSCKDEYVVCLFHAEFAEYADKEIPIILRILREIKNIFSDNRLCRSKNHCTFANELGQDKSINMNYTEKTKRVEEIIAEINSGTTDPGAIIAKIEEAKKLIAECQTELTALEKNLDENSK